MNLAPAPASYDVTDQAQMRGELNKADKQNQKVGQPIILTASDGSRWRLSVSTSGTLSAVAA